MDDGLRVAIWNYLYEYHLHSAYISLGQRGTSPTINQFWARFLKRRLDTINILSAPDDIRKWFYNAEWYEIYDVLECFSSDDPEKINGILAREESSYRVINGRIVPITSTEEIVEVEEAATASSHILKAIELLSSYQNPDVENIIKESMLAVEYEVKDAHRGRPRKGAREDCDAFTTRTGLEEYVPLGKPRIRCPACRA